MKQQLMNPRTILLITLMLGLASGCEGTRGTLTYDAAQAPLTDEAPSADRGLLVFVDRDKGHCVLCHQVQDLDAPFQGNLGPELTDIGARLTAAQIRFRIVDASRLNPATIMPPYFRTDGLYRVASDLVGEPVLSAREIEDLVAYLVAMKGNES